MTTLTDYETETLELLHDPSFTYYSQTDIDNYINRARLRIAARSQCVQVLAPMTTVIGQEIYLFSAANSLVSITPGVLSVLGVISVAVAWGTNAVMKPMLNQMVWDDLQAYYRSYSIGLQSYPTIWAKYGSGVNASMYVWPIPSTASLMEWNTWCLPVTLTSPSTPEAIPYEWTPPVAFYAASLAFFNAQRFEDSDRMKKEYEEKLLEAQAVTNAPFVPTYYESDY